MVRGCGKGVEVGRPIGLLGACDKFDVLEKGAMNKPYPALRLSREMMEKSRDH
jgi:hypothetical protein